MKHLRHYIRNILKEAEELTPKQEVANIMGLWDDDSWEQAQELAYMLGPEVGRHPDLKIWHIMNGENGDVVVSDVNYDQAMDPKYQAFVIFTGGYETIDDRPEPGFSGKIGGGSVRDHPVPQQDFDDAMGWLEQEGQKTKVVEVDDEVFSVAVVMEEA